MIIRRRRLRFFRKEVIVLGVSIRKRPRGWQEEAPIAESGRDHANKDAGFVGLADGGGSSEFIFGWIRFILDFPSRGGGVFVVIWKTWHEKDSEQDGW